MIFLISFVIAAVFALFCDKAIKKVPQAFYIGAAALALFFVIFDFSNANQFVKDYIVAIFQKGTLATALFVIVMFTGALKNGSYLIKKLMPIRAELSIIASILILIHGFNYGKIYIVRLFKASASMPAVQIIFTVFSIVMLAIMIPLAVISFKKIRKKMSAKRWKNIQRCAYAFYGLIYLHILLIYLPSAQKGNTKNIVNVIVYSVVFISYAVMRIRKAVLKKHKEAGKTVSISFGSAGFALMAVVCALVFVPYSHSLKDVSEPVAYANAEAGEKENDKSKYSLNENTAEDSVSDIEDTGEITSDSTTSDNDKNSDVKNDTDTAVNSKSAKKSSDTDKNKSESKSSDTSSKEKTSDTNSKNTQTSLEKKTQSKTEDKKDQSSSSSNSNDKTSSKTSSKNNTSSKSNSTTSSKANTSSKNNTSSKTNNNTTSSKSNTSSNNVSSREEVSSVNEPAVEDPITAPIEEPPVEEPVQTKYRDGEYSAKRFGYDGYVYVTIVIESDRIVSLEATSDEEDLWYFDQAHDVLVPKILEEQRTDLDAVSGATISSDAIKGAVEDALKKAEN